MATAKRRQGTSGVSRYKHTINHTPTQSLCYQCQRWRRKPLIIYGTYLLCIIRQKYVWKKKELHMYGTSLMSTKVSNFFQN
jgi:hypothetical protein